MIINVHRHALLDSCILADNKGPGLAVGLVEVVVDDNLVVGGVRAVGKVHFELCLVEALEDIGFLVGGAAAQSLLEDVHAGGREEEEARAGERGVVCDLLDALGGLVFVLVT